MLAIPGADHRTAGTDGHRSGRGQGLRGRKPRVHRLHRRAERELTAEEGLLGEVVADPSAGGQAAERR